MLKSDLVSKKSSNLEVQDGSDVPLTAAGIPSSRAPTANNIVTVGLKNTKVTTTTNFALPAHLFNYCAWYVICKNALTAQLHTFFEAWETHIIGDQQVNVEEPSQELVSSMAATAFSSTPQGLAVETVAPCPMTLSRVCPRRHQRWQNGQVKKTVPGTR